jgi:hypothetical protein
MGIEFGIPGVKPFVVQNLGKYERQAWQEAEFPSNGQNHLEEQRERESAYRRFILDLYHCETDEWTRMDSRTEKRKDGSRWRG